MDFFDAMLKALSGDKVTRTGWESGKDYVFFKDDFLHIYISKELHTWAISKEDVLAKDWAVK